jgi:hypothetical protein
VPVFLRPLLLLLMLLVLLCFSLPLLQSVTATS